MSTTYISAVPLTMVRTVEGGYRNVLEGDPIAGEAVDPEDLERLVRKKFLVEKALDEEEFDPAKGGNVKDSAAWVGSDKERAQQLLDLEQAKVEKDRRPSLVEKLQAVLAAE